MRHAKSEHVRDALHHKNEIVKGNHTFDMIAFQFVLKGLFQ